jgi:predicted nucleic acid-binding protein
MKWLLDVDMLCALAWQSHARHMEARRWLDAGAQVVTSPIAELGFLRVSLHAYRATFEDAQIALQDITSRADFLADDVRAANLPKCSAALTTDAHLLVLARRHGMKLATLDEGLLKQTWAKNFAETPL